MHDLSHSNNVLEHMNGTNCLVGGENSLYMIASLGKTKVTTGSKSLCGVCYTANGTVNMHH